MIIYYQCGRPDNHTFILPLSLQPSPPLDRPERRRICCIQIAVTLHPEVTDDSFWVAWKANRSQRSFIKSLHMSSQRQVDTAPIPAWVVSKFRKSYSHVLLASGTVHYWRDGINYPEYLYIIFKSIAAIHLSEIITFCPCRKKNSVLLLGREIKALWPTKEPRFVISGVKSLFLWPFIDHCVDSDLSALMSTEWKQLLCVW